MKNYRIALSLGLVLALAQSPALCSPDKNPEQSERQLATVNPLAQAAPSSFMKKPQAQKAARATRAHKRPTRPAAKRKVQEEKNECEIALPWGGTLKGLDEDIVDTCQTMAYQVRKLIGRRADQAMGWISEMARQVNAPPTMTPLGSPYVTNKLTNKLFWTAEGRVKTVIER